MKYPKDPVGLRWDEHYLMSNQVFYACVQAVKGRVPLPGIRAEATEKKEHGPFKKRLGGRRIA